MDKENKIIKENLGYLTRAIGCLQAIIPFTSEYLSTDQVISVYAVIKDIEDLEVEFSTLLK